jgi:hypothetical protein
MPAVGDSYRWLAGVPDRLPAQDDSRYADELVMNNDSSEQ